MTTDRDKAADKNKDGMVIAVDFDGTLVEHKFPRIGEDIPEAFEWLRKFQARGARLILHTMRSGAYLMAAVGVCRNRGVKFWGINVNPEQHEWTASKKVYAKLYIDDAAFGCPVTAAKENGRKPADWSIIGPAVDQMLRERSEQ